ncbi:MAG: glycine cleavage system aminomethyltransferase GcvT [Rickettsiales bacterium]|nr:glycine cleavage system aminomethyltransferase GcvT [Rickettsiales bacterium]
MENAKKTPLYDAHIAMQGKMVEFAGYAMPVQYPMGLAKEHLWVRENVGMFDVSHMGQAYLEGEGAAEFLSFITPSPFMKTPHGNAKYTVLPNDKGGVIDDLIITRLSEDKFFIVFNASRKEIDAAWMEKHMPDTLTLTMLPSRALIAVQGPKAEVILSQHVKEPLTEQGYMTIQTVHLNDGTEIFISRLGYTGEDGFEISIEGDKAADFWNALAAHDEVEPAGLGARDTLRLEMGYPLYGHDLDEETSPIQSSLGWVVSKKNDIFMGAERILADRENGPATKRVGIKLLDRGVARENTPIVNEAGESIGTLTSGGFSPTLNAAIGQGYLPAAYADEGSKVFVEVRGKKLAAEVTGLTFIQANTKTKKQSKAA